MPMGSSQVFWLASAFVAASALTLTIDLPNAWSDAPSVASLSRSPQLDEEEAVDGAAHKILSDHCIACHGPANQEGGLRLDRAEAALRGGDHGPALVPGKSHPSRLFQRVSGQKEPRMPPEGPPLSADQLAILERWIDRGAFWPKDGLTSTSVRETKTREIPWSFRPIHSMALPVVNDSEWSCSPIDRFVLAKIEQEGNGMSPSPQAERHVLLRRLSLDLLGLPPSDEELREFIQDTRPDAYDRFVDRYLASPHYGERWGRHWLDRTHYGESSGCLTDLSRPYAWRWRDWVVEAINRDLPFDQFTIQQIAGDLMHERDSESTIATGFYRNALMSYEPGIDLEAERCKTTVDRTSMVGSAWLGITLGCAECHSHKYDPITQRDFYRMYAFFDRTEDVYLDSLGSTRSPLRTRAEAAIDSARRTYLSQPAHGQLEWEDKVKRLPNIWHVPKEYGLRTLRSLRFAMVHPQADGALKVDGVIRSSDRHQVEFAVPIQSIRAVRIELLPDDERFHLGPGRCKNGECVLTGISIMLHASDGSMLPVSSKFQSVQYDYCQEGYQAKEAIECKEESGWSVNQPGVSHAAIYRLDAPIPCETGNHVTIQLEFSSGRGRTPTRFRVAVTDASDTSLVDQAVPEDIRELLHRDRSLRTEQEQALLKRYYQSTYRPLDCDLAIWNKSLEIYSEISHPRGAECVRESWNPPETYIHMRGDFKQRGDRVEPGIPSSLELPGYSPGSWSRLELARWMVHPKNPLTSRVAVNSFWQPLFGNGLVRTPDDFGHQGDKPTHPELLDWLSNQLMRDEWSRKGILRRMVSSATYQQSSTTSVSRQQADPLNRLFARQSRVRLDAEVLRDCLLERSGLLDLTMGGPSYRPPRSPDDPKWDWEPLEWEAPESYRYRRGLYIAVARNSPDPLLSLLDAPDGTTFCPARQRTNTPLQAMTLMNDPIFVSGAQRLAEQMVHSSEVTERERLERLWRACLGRDPESDEMAILEDLFRRMSILHRSEGREIPLATKEYIWFLMARTLLNLDEVMTRE